LALGDALVLDIVIDGRLVVELKAVDAIEAVHEAQLLTYLRLSGIRLGLLIRALFRIVWRSLIRPATLVG
jgi:GxxExxY protein